MDVEVKWDRLFSVVAEQLPQYTIPELRRTLIHKFMRLVMKAEELQKRKAKQKREANRAAGISRAVK